MTQRKIAGIGPATKRVKKEKPKAYQEVADRIKAARRAKGLPELGLTKLQRSKLGKGARRLFTPHQEEVKRQMRRKK